MKWNSPTVDFFEGIKNGESGVYIIREKHGVIRYVGESHTGRLRKTAARHFQEWNGNGAGHTYPRDGFEIFVKRTPARRAFKSQNEEILKQKPTDNEIGVEDPPPNANEHDEKDSEEKTKTVKVGTQKNPWDFMESGDSGTDFAEGWDPF